MQKVKKAAAQLDSRAAISVLNNLKNNQIVVENYNIFCELYEKAILCKDYSLAPLFSDGSLIVKQKINDDCIDLIINFSVNFTEKGSILANLRSHNENNSSSKSFQKLADSVQVISLNSLRFKTANKKVANMLKSKKVHRMTESWSVRGHYRHYKSGKVIFIESFKKGKNRKQASQKKTKYKL